MPIKTKENYQETFSKLNITNETINQTNFEKCKFTKCIFHQTTFKNCKMIGIDWTKSQPEILPISIQFDKCNINLSSFYRLAIDDFKLKNCSAKEVDFRGSILIKADFSSSNLEKSLFHDTDLTSANFTQAKNYLIDFHSNKIKKSIHNIPEVLNLLKPLDIKIEY